MPSMVNRFMSAAVILLNFSIAKIDAGTNRLQLYLIAFLLIHVTGILSDRERRNMPLRLNID